MSSDVPADPGFLCDNAAVLGDSIKGAPVFIGVKSIMNRRCTEDKSYVQQQLFLGLAISEIIT
jgi:hypothetical protein